MTIVPDTKDWTWVLTRPCPECAFDAGALSRYDVPRRLRAAAADLTRALAAPDPDRRPAPAVWSPLEYSCHVRDVFRVFLARLERMLAEDDPVFANWDQDRTAVEDDYAAQDPAVVSGELRAAADTLADRFAGLPDDAWQRPGRRSDGAVFTVTTFSQYLVHDPEHHVWDVRSRAADA